MSASSLNWAVIVAAIVALFGFPIGHWLQGRRERRLWTAEKRLDAYAALLAAHNQLAGQTGILARVLADKATDDVSGRFHEEWVAAFTSYIAANYRATLLPGELGDQIELMERNALEMGALMQEIEVAENPEPSIQQLKALGRQAGQLRAEFVKQSRKVIP